MVTRYKPTVIDAKITAINAAHTDGQFVAYEDYVALEAERDAALAKIEELRGWWETETKNVSQEMVKRAKAESERETLRDALRVFGQHRWLCKGNVVLTSFPPQFQKCDCGLDDALQLGMLDPAITAAIDEVTR